jgi:hypothetical protein
MRIFGIHTAFSASSRRLDLNGAAKPARKKQSSSHHAALTLGDSFSRTQIRMRFSVHTS